MEPLRWFGRLPLYGVPFDWLKGTAVEERQAVPHAHQPKQLGPALQGSAESRCLLRNRISTEQRTDFAVKEGRSLEGFGPAGRVAFRAPPRGAPTLMALGPVRVASDAPDQPLHMGMAEGERRFQ